MDIEENAKIAKDQRDIPTISITKKSIAKLIKTFYLETQTIKVNIISKPTKGKGKGFP